MTAFRAAASSRISAFRAGTSSSPACGSRIPAVGSVGRDCICFDLGLGDEMKPCAYGRDWRGAADFRKYRAMCAERPSRRGLLPVLLITLAFAHPAPTHAASGPPDPDAPPGASRQWLPDERWVMDRWT